jgi:hypothetical protein
LAAGHEEVIRPWRPRRSSSTEWYNRKLVMLEDIQDGLEKMKPEDVMDGHG